MADIATSSNKRKNVFSKSINRRSTRVDLTPMVDLGFLLITFFVFTTSMSQAKVMDLIEPHDGSETLVPESGAMTIILGKNHQIYYYYGELNEQLASTQLAKTNFKSIRSLILNMKLITKTDKLMYIIKSAENSTFGNSIDLLDEISICDIPQGHYAEVDITKTEAKLIKSIE